MATAMRPDAHKHGYQRNPLSLSTPPKNRTTESKLRTSEPSCHDGPAWCCTGALSPCICRQPPGERDGLQLSAAWTEGSSLYAESRPDLVSLVSLVRTFLQRAPTRERTVLP